MNDYISKPVSPQALVEAPDKWLPKEPAAAAKQAMAGNTAESIDERILEPYMKRKEKQA